MSTRSSRAARRRRRRRAQQLSPSERQLVRLNDRFRREALQREAAAQQAREVPPADPKALAREIRQAEQHAEMLKLIARTKAREEARARRDHERSVRDEHEPMQSMAWSPTMRRMVP